MNSMLQAPHGQADRDLFRITVFAKRILRIGGQPQIQQQNYLFENTFFTHVTVDEAIKFLNDGEAVDAVMYHSDAVIHHLKNLVLAARTKAVPVIWYTTKYEASAKRMALENNADAYH